MIKRFWHWLMAREAIVRSRWEMVVMRVLFATVMFDFTSRIIPLVHDAGPFQAAATLAQDFQRKVVDLAQGQAFSTDENLLDLAVIPKKSEFKDQRHPHGLAIPLEKWFHRKLTFLSDPDVAGPMAMGFYLAIGLYVLGVGLPVALGYLFVVMLLHGTFLNSQGSIHHHLQLFTLILGLQWVASVAGVLRSPRSWHHWLRMGDWGFAKMTSWTQQAMVAGYVVSALSKLWFSHGRWIWSTPRIGVQLSKAVDQDYYDSLEHSAPAMSWLDGLCAKFPDATSWIFGPESLSSRSAFDWFPEWCLNHPWTTRLVFGPALPLEFFFFLALRNRRIGTIYALALIAFHFSVSSLMSLDFRYNVQLLVIYFVNVPFWAWALWRRFGRESNAPVE